MKSVHLIISILIFCSCSKTTQEQREKFENCRNNLSGLSGLVIQLEIETTYGKNSFYDMFEMNLEEFITKYNIPTEKVDSFLKSLCDNGNFEKHPIEYENIIYQTYDVDSDTILNRKN